MGKKGFIYITDKEYTENGALKNPVIHSDIKFEEIFQEFGLINYDLKLIVTTPPTEEEINNTSIPYNDYRERYGTTDISCFDKAINENEGKNILLCGFKQEHWEYIAPLIKDKCEIIYFFKCPKIKDLSALSKFQNLKCVRIYWNNSLETLWEMKDNSLLEVISFVTISKLKHIESLKKSTVKYINFDSSDIIGNNKKEMLFDEKVFEDMPDLKALRLIYKKK